MKAWSRTAVAAAAVVLAATTPAAAEENAEDLVRRTADEVLVILRDETLPGKDKRDRLEVLLVDRADFPTISKLVLARNWKKLEEEDREEFASLFQRYLSVTYGRNVDNYSNEKIEILGSRDEAFGDRTVQTKVVRNGPDDILVDYRLRQIDGEWKIIDVVAERVSMISNLRSQFQEIISDGGTEKLMAVLREKTAEEASEDG